MSGRLPIPNSQDQDPSHASRFHMPALLMVRQFLAEYGGVFISFFFEIVVVERLWPPVISDLRKPSVVVSWLFRQTRYRSPHR
jgi:hypothetical protein